MVARRCTFRCLDCSVIKEWWQSCEEYSGYITRPLSPIPLRHLWKCDQSNWDSAYSQWSALQFWLGLTVAIVQAVWRILDNANILHTAIGVMVRACVAYAFAHLGWFAVVRKGGCICCILACCECGMLLFVWGILAIVYGILGLVDCLNVSVNCFASLCLAVVIVQALYSIILFYLGLCGLKIWGARGSQLIEPLEVHGPNV